MRQTWMLLMLCLAASCTSKKRLSSSSSNFSKQQKIVSIAKTYIGKPYKYGGQGPKSFDCSGFTSYVFHQGGVLIPRTTGEQATVGSSVKRVALKPGDLIFFRKNKGGKKLNHVGIIQSASPNSIQVIHSTSSKGVISENVLLSSYWKERILFFRRVI